MHIIGKSAIKRDDLIGKSKICKNIEIQLFDEYDNFDDPNDELFETITSVKNIDVIVVHAPLSNNEDTNIEYIENEIDRYKITKTIELADMLGKHYSHDVKVVLHTSFRFELFEKFPSVLRDIKSFLREKLITHKNVIICIENTIPCIPHRKDTDIHFRSGVIHDNVKLVKYLRKELNTDKIGTVLDTCHVMTTVKILEKILDIKDYRKYLKKHDIESFFRENKDFIQLIHLADLKNLGYNEGEHGVKFENDRINVMEYFVDLYKKYGYECDITIEITEDDYVENENFRDNYEKLEKMLKNNKKF